MSFIFCGDRIEFPSDKKAKASKVFNDWEK
jgi:hypothetical protein